MPLCLLGGGVVFYILIGGNKNNIRRKNDMAKVELKQPIVAEISELLSDAKAAVVALYNEFFN